MGVHSKRITRSLKLINDCAVSPGGPERIAVRLPDLGVHPEEPAEAHGRIGCAYQTRPQRVEKLDRFLEPIPILWNHCMDFPLVWLNVDAHQDGNVLHVCISNGGLNGLGK